MNTILLASVLNAGENVNNVLSVLDFGENVNNVISILDFGENANTLRRHAHAVYKDF